MAVESARRTRQCAERTQRQGSVRRTQGAPDESATAPERARVTPETPESRRDLSAPATPRPAAAARRAAVTH